MTRTYKYLGAPEQRVIGPLAPGDYAFQVAEIGEVYESGAGNLVLPVKITILPQSVPVFANCWTGTDRNGDERDGIAEFLLCVNRAPKVGEEPSWKSIPGAKGRCRLKVETAQQGALAGKEVNKVAFFHRPKEVGPATEVKQDFSSQEVAEQKTQPNKAAGGPNKFEPDDIPF